MRLGWMILASLACFAASFYLFINVGTSNGQVAGVGLLVVGVLLLTVAMMGHGSGRAARRRRNTEDPNRRL